MGATWNGARYYRKGSKTWRDSNKGTVYSESGIVKGEEKNNHHFYGGDPKKIRGKQPSRIKIKKLNIKVRKK